MTYKAPERKVARSPLAKICNGIAKELGQGDAPCYHWNRATFLIMQAESSFIETCLMVYLPNELQDKYAEAIHGDKKGDINANERCRLDCKTYFESIGLYVRTVKLLCEVDGCDDIGEVVYEICKGGAVDRVIVRYVFLGTIEWSVVPYGAVNYDI